MALRLKTRSEDDTFALGRALGAFLRPGDALLLSGDLGTGKSVLARGAARSLGVEGPMPSPSFTILFPYEGKCPVYHFDLYRLSGPDEFEAAGLYEWFGGAGVCLVEWPETVDLDARPCVRLTLRRAAEDGARDVELVTDGVPLNEAAFAPWRAEQA
ncbi:MAG TPA: tRNA (adenosine(37)-N6)-threonylcarbamoyltransferase complex ATPase subunit type 1 TsaE [Candidatus Pullichristensenella excrementipullorum]|nr:tRNA (adenosine(37)-N6)-threonylcarbamoyltransferase complex ATPase subunit type 1 TsaE [Candidatus Pullichristensenella excrementipullorum]